MTFMVAVALTPRGAGIIFGIDALVVLGVAALASIPATFVARRALVALPFLSATVFLPFVSSGERTEVLGVAVSAVGLEAAGGIAAKALLGTLTAIVLTATTEAPELLRGLRRLRVPATLVAIAGFALRYLDTLANQLTNMRIAMTSRGYEPRGLWNARPIANSAGTLFVRSYEQGERAHQAMVSRGFTGSMPDTDHRSATATDWLRAVSAPIVAVAALILAFWQSW